MNLPNKLTLLRIAAIPFFVVCMLVEGIPNRYLWAFFIFVGAALTDLLDGKIARSRGLVTDFGKLMDPLADKLLVMAAMVSFVGLGVVPAWVVIVILAREFLVTSIRLVAAPKGRVLAADIYGKWKTVFQMAWMSFLLLAQWSVGVGFYTGSVLKLIHLVLMTATLLLTVFSGFNYVWKNRDLIADA